MTEFVGDDTADVIDGTEGYTTIRTNGGDDRISSLSNVVNVYAGAGDDVIEFIFYDFPPEPTPFEVQGNDGDDFLALIFYSSEIARFNRIMNGDLTANGGAGFDTLSLVFPDAMPTEDSFGVDYLVDFDAVAANFERVELHLLDWRSTQSVFLKLEPSKTIYVVSRGGADTIVGGSRDDVVDLGDGDDIARTLGGDDVVIAGEGDDRILTSGGNDEVFGVSGNDTIVGGGGNDTLTGDDGNDRINGGGGADSILGGEDQDRIKGNGGSDTIFGGSGDDTLNGNAGDDLLLGEDGSDDLNGNGGDDSIAGGAGDDILRGGGGSDILAGEAGDDTLIGGAGRDVFSFVGTEVGSGSPGRSVDWGRDEIQGFDPRQDLLAFVDETLLRDEFFASLTEDGTATIFDRNADGRSVIVFLNTSIEDLEEVPILFRNEMELGF